MDDRAWIEEELGDARAWVSRLEGELEVLDDIAAGEKRELRPEVLCCQWFRSNAELIQECARLGYLRNHIATLDPTHEKGVWWQLWRPDILVTHDVEKDGVDFRDLPYPDGHFAQIAFDPPYVCVGGRSTSTLPDFLNRYGIDNAPRTPEALLAMNVDGLREIHRVCADEGLVLMKYQNQVWSGSLFLGAHLMLEAALDIGFTIEDTFVHGGNKRPQPKRTRKHEPCKGQGCPGCGGTGREDSTQQHARQNVSYLYVLRRGKRVADTAQLFEE